MKAEIKKIYSLIRSKDENSMTNQAIISSSYSFLTNIISRIGALIFTILLARTLLPTMFGAYSLALSVILTIATFTDLGINSAMSRYVSESLSRGKKYEKEARSRLRFLFNLKTTLSVGVSLILFLLSPIIANEIFNKPELIVPLQIGALYLFAMTTQTFMSYILITLRKMKYNLFSETLFQASRIILFLIFIQAYREVSTIFWILTVSYAVSGIFLFVMTLLERRKLWFGNIIPVDRKRIVVFLGWIIVLSTSLVLFMQIDTFMLGIFIESKYLAYYSTLGSVIDAITGFIAFSAIFLPIFTQIGGERLSRGFKKTIKYSLILAIPAAIGLMFVITPLIRIVYGVEYSPFGYYPPLLIAAIFLCLLLIEAIFTGMYNSVFIAKDKVKTPAILVVITTVLNVILNYFFIRFSMQYGQEWALVGVAAATFVARYTHLAILGILAKRQLDISPDFKDILKPIAASILMLAFLFTFNYLFNPGLWLSIVMICLVALIYAASIYLFN